MDHIVGPCWQCCVKDQWFTRLNWEPSKGPPWINFNILALQHVAHQDNINMADGVLNVNAHFRKRVSIKMAAINSCLPAGTLHITIRKWGRNAFPDYFPKIPHNTQAGHIQKNTFRCCLLSLHRGWIAGLEPGAQKCACILMWGCLWLVLLCSF